LYGGSGSAGDQWITNKKKRKPQFFQKKADEDSQMAIVPDVRFTNEVKAIKDNGGIVIRLTRNMFSSDSESESSLDSDKFDWHNFDIVIDNHNMTLEVLCDELKNNNFWRF
jgi:hypothetical protein